MTITTTSMPYHVIAVGAGKQMGDHRLRDLKLVLGDAVLAVVDPELDRAAALARRFGVPRVFGSQREARLALERAGLRVDGAMIVVGNEAHFATGVEAMSYGWDVFGEKPIAPDWCHAQELVAYGIEHRINFTIGYPYPYDRGLAWVREQIESGELGGIQRVKLRFTRQNGFPAAHYWSDRATGGVALDFAGHPIAAVLQLLGGEPDTVADAHCWSEHGTLVHGESFAVEDTVEATIRFSDGVRLSLEMSWADFSPTSEEFAIEFRCERGWAGVECAALNTRARQPVVNTWSRTSGGGRIESRYGPPPSTYEEMALAHTRNWVDVGRGIEQRLRFSAADALEAERIVHAVRVAARTGQRVEVRTEESGVATAR
jgi:predicted dehydrogenase